MSFALYHQIIVAPDAAPRGYAVFLHGLLGQGVNWRSTATKLTRKDPAWAAVLVDLRLHGRSQGAPPPHTLGSTADDVEALMRALGADGRPVRAIVGHSFGGKVGLALRARAPAGLLATCVFDASPSARPELARPDATNPSSILAVIEAVAAAPRRYARRDELIAALGARGIAPGIGKWLAMGLVADGDGYVLPFDQAGVRALLESHVTTDLWSAVDDPALPGALSFYVAGRSEALSPADRARLAALAPRIATHTFPDAEHWMLTERDALELPPC